MAFLVCGEGLRGGFRVDMAMGKTQSFPLRGEVELAGLALDPFLEDVDRNDPLDGQLSAKLRLTRGSLVDQESLSGDLVVSLLDVGQGDVRLRNEGPLEVSLRRGDFTVDRAQLSGPSSTVRITGGGTNERGLALEVAGDLDLSFLASLTPNLTHAGGTIAAHVNVTGPFEAPGIYGRAVVRDGSFRYAGLRDPLTDLDGEITFSARRILFEDFSAQMAGGRLALSGAATLEGRGLSRYDFDVEARDVTIHPDRDVDVTFGGLAHLGWTSGQRLPRLTGTIRLERVSYEKPIQIAAMVGAAAREGMSGRPGRTNIDQYDPDNDHVELDVRLVEANPMRIQNNLIDAEVRIEDSERPFRIVGTDQRFGAIGNLNIPRGVIYFRNKEFDVRRGTIEFDDPYRVDPNFAVSAVTDVRRTGDLAAPNWRITLNATGNSDNFQLNTRSDPELSQEDIVLLLTIGMTSAELEQLQAGDVGSTLAVEALAAVTGIDREVQRALPVIDDFSVSSRYSQRTNRTEPQVTVGKRISDRVRLTASTGISESSAVRASVEWRLGEQTSVQAVYDNYNTTTASTLGNVGVDLHWRLEFE
jgi:translocation and assembly module TamB